MRWIAFVESPQHVCCRYRLAAFRPLLERLGYTLELQTLPRQWWARLPCYRQVRGDNVILQRKLLPAWELALLRRQAQRLVFDFDDALFLRDSYAAKGLYDGRRMRRFTATVRACDAVVAGNDYLAEVAARYINPANVHVIPTCVNPALYPPAGYHKTDGPVDLVWVGSSSTLQGLEAVTPLLEELGASVPNLRLKLICDRFPCFQNLPVIACPWRGATEAAELASADIGISWIPDDEWSRGKCGLKVLQYMAAGLSVVANPVGVHPRLVHHGETGFLADSPAEWTTAISALATDPALRQRLGNAGRRLLETEYGVRTGARLWSEVFCSLGVRQFMAG